MMSVAIERPLCESKSLNRIIGSQVIVEQNGAPCSRSHSPPVRDSSEVNLAPLASLTEQSNVPTEQQSNTESQQCTEMEKKVRFLEGKLSTLLTDLDNAFQERDKHLAAFSQLKSQHLTMEHEDVTARVNDILTDKQRLQESLTKAYQEQASMRSEAAMAASTLDVAVQKEANLKQQVDSLTADLTAKTDELLNLKRMVHALKNQLTELTRDRDLVEKERQNVLADVTRMEGEISHFQEQLTTYRQAQEQWTQQRDALQQQVDHWTVHSTALQTHNDTLKLQLLQMKNQVIADKKKVILQLECVEQEIVIKDAQIQQVQQEQNSLLAKLTHLEEMLTQRELDLHSTQEKANHLESQLLTVQQQLTQCQQQLDHLQQENQQLQAQQAAGQALALEREQNMLREQNDKQSALSQQLQLSIHNCAGLQQQLEELHTSRQQLHTSLTERDQLLQNVQTQLRQVEGEYSRAVEEVNELKQSLCHSSDAIREFHADRDQLSSQLEQLQQLQAAQSAQFTQLHDQLATVTGVKAKLAQENANLLEELHTLKQQRDQLEVEVVDCKQSKCSLQEAHNAVCEKLHCSQLEQSQWKDTAEKLQDTFSQQLDAVLSEKQRLQQEVNALSKVRDECQQVKWECDTLKKDQERRGRVLEQLKEDKVRVQKSAEKLQNDLTQLHHSHNQLLLQKQQTDLDLQEALGRISAMQDYVQVIKTHDSQLIQKLVEHEKTMQILRSAVQRTDTLHSATRKDLRTATDRAEQFQAMHDTLATVCDQLRRDVAMKTHSCVTLMQAVEQKDRLLAEASAKMDELEAELAATCRQKEQATTQSMELQQQTARLIHDRQQLSEKADFFSSENKSLRVVANNELKRQAELRQTLTDCQQNYQSKMTELYDLLKVRTENEARLEAQVRGMRSQMQQLLTSCRDNRSVSLEQLKAVGVDPKLSSGSLRACLEELRQEVQTLEDN